MNSCRPPRLAVALLRRTGHRTLTHGGKTVELIYPGRTANFATTRLDHIEAAYHNLRNDR